MTALRCYVCTHAIGPEQQADEAATTWVEGHGWAHLACLGIRRYGREAMHWRVEPQEEEDVVPPAEPDEFPELAPADDLEARYP